MFTSIVRRWAAALITAGAAAAAVLALAVPAGASTGTTEISPEHAGYTATGAQFKAVSGGVYLRDPTQYKGIVARYGHSVQLWSADRVVSVNLTASTSGKTYTPSATIYDRSTHHVIASDPNATYSKDRAISWNPGVGPPRASGLRWGLYIWYIPASGDLRIYAEEETYGYDLIEWSYQLPGQSFTQARIGTEFGNSPWDATYTHTPPAKLVKAAAYSGASLTTYSGHKDDLSSWWVHHQLLANTGQQSGSDWVATPHNLTDGGASFQTWFVPTSGQSHS